MPKLFRKKIGQSVELPIFLDLLPSEASVEFCEIYFTQRQEKYDLSSNLLLLDSLTVSLKIIDRSFIILLFSDASYFEKFLGFMALINSCTVDDVTQEDFLKVF